MKFPRLAYSLYSTARNANRLQNNIVTSSRLYAKAIVSPTETPSANVVAADGGIEPLKKNRKTPFEALEKRISALEQREIEREKEKERSLLPQSSGTAAQAAEMQEAHQEKTVPSIGAADDPTPLPQLPPLLSAPEGALVDPPGTPPPSQQAAGRVPYLVSICHPDYKRPYVSFERGSAVDAKAAREAILRVIVDHLVEYELPVVCAFEDHFYWESRGGYMEMDPIKSSYFADNNWEYPTFTQKQFIAAYKKSKKTASKK